MNIFASKFYSWIFIIIKHLSVTDEEQTMSQYMQDIEAVNSLKANQGNTWQSINPESAARMRIQNRFKTGLDMQNTPLKSCAMI